MTFSSKGYSESQIRTYDRSTSVVFLKTHESFGGLSNMAGGFPLCVNGSRIRTSEALYQVCRFPHLPEVQRLIIEQKSPMTAKMKSKPYRRDSRQDWDNVRVKVMRWCLRVKLAQNWQEFGKLLLETGERPIVEDSRKDDFWGAKPTDDQTLVGMNALGRLLMELREAVKNENRDTFLHVKPLAIPDFLLFGKLIGEVGLKEAEQTSTIAPISVSVPQRDTTVIPLTQLTFFDAIEVPAVAQPEPRRPTQEGMPMIADLKPYPAYRESGLSWLGDVPEHWDVKRLKLLLREVDFRSSTGKEQLLRVSQYTGVTQRKSIDGTDLPDSRAASLVGYKKVQPDDLVINIMLAWNGSMGVSCYEGIASPAYCVYRFNSTALPLYYHELLRIPLYKGRIKAASTGVVESRLRLYSDDLGCIETILPPPDEQAAIVRFLGWANGQLEKAIRAKRKVITLLNEQKQAIIHSAVTRGLDSSVPLKPSGISWLGDIPQHWEGRRISTACDLVVDGTHFSPPNDSVGEFLYITAKNVKEYGIETSNATYIKAMDHRDIYRRCPVRKYDVIYIKDGATAGLATVNNLDEEFSMLSSIALLRPKPSVLFPDFLALSLNDRLFKQNALSKVVGGAMTRFTIALIKRFPLLIPPLSEQLLIVSAVNNELNPILSVQSNIEREIELLREYRTRLVADVVTGKLDVREAAAKLPDEALIDLPDNDSVEALEDEPFEEEALV